jgi:lysophospholipase L1-like esterase
MNLKKIAQIFILVLFGLLLAEGVLRLQQAIGPIYDLALQQENCERLSETLNHKPRAVETWALADRKIFGSHAGYRYTVRHDENGIRINDLRPHFAAEDHPIRILFLGDSFVEGYGDSTTLVQHVWERLQETPLKSVPIELLNAGHSSYSPAIFIPQVKQLVPKLKPDLLVIVIDETDLGDDYIRYQHLIVRDLEGRNIGVRPTPINEELVKGLLKVRQHKSYLVRLLHKIYHTRIYMPAFRKGYRTRYPHWVLHLSKDHDPEAGRIYHGEIAFFEDNLTELARMASDLMGGPDRILFVYHPHLHHLVPDESGHLWNNFTAEAVARVAQREGVPFYNATEDLQQRFGGRSQDFYWHGEMHFNFRGFHVYGRTLADRLVLMLTPLAEVREASLTRGAGARPLPASD